MRTFYKNIFVRWSYENEIFFNATSQKSYRNLIKLFFFTTYFYKILTQNMNLMPLIRQSTFSKTINYHNDFRPDQNQPPNFQKEQQNQEDWMKNEPTPFRPQIPDFSEYDPRSRILNDRISDSAWAALSNDGFCAKSLANPALVESRSRPIQSTLIFASSGTRRKRN